MEEEGGGEKKVGKGSVRLRMEEKFKDEERGWKGGSIRMRREEGGSIRMRREEGREVYG